MDETTPKAGARAQVHSALDRAEYIEDIVVGEVDGGQELGHGGFQPGAREDPPGPPGPSCWAATGPDMVPGPVPLCEAVWTV